jgi:hypothetical protein
MPDVPTPEDLVEEEEKPLREGSPVSAYILDAVDEGVDVATNLAEPAVEAAVEAGGAILESAVDVIGSVLGSIFD